MIGFPGHFSREKGRLGLEIDQSRFSTIIKRGVAFYGVAPTATPQLMT
jgi:hypothetical protein